MIKERKRLWGTRWIIAGDFNDIVYNEKKWGGRMRAERTFKEFKAFITKNELS